MSMTIRSAAVLAAVSGTAWLGASPASAQEVTLKLHHFLGPAAPAQRAFFEPWAQRVQEQSGGRIKVDTRP